MPRVLDQKVAKSRITHSERNHCPTREHRVSGGVRLKALLRVVTTVSELSVSVDSVVTVNVAGTCAA